MPYSLTEQRMFFEKDAKTNISIVVQSAFNKAADCIIERQRGESKVYTMAQITEQVIALRDMFFNENQHKIEYEFTKWLELNPIQGWYSQLQAKDEEIKDAQTPTINQELPL